MIKINKNDNIVDHLLKTYDHDGLIVDKTFYILSEEEFNKLKNCPNCVNRKECIDYNDERNICSLWKLKL